MKPDSRLHKCATCKLTWDLMTRPSLCKQCRHQKYYEQYHNNYEKRQAIKARNQKYKDEIDKPKRYARTNANAEKRKLLKQLFDNMPMEAITNILNSQNVVIN